MYFARDEASAEATAGLRCIELSGRGLPTFFRKKKPVMQSATTAQSANSATNASLGHPDQVSEKRTQVVAYSARYYTLVWPEFGAKNCKPV